MMNLAEYRKRPALLADYLPWAALVAKGVVLNKDGSFQRTARFRGPDLDSATPTVFEQRFFGWLRGGATTDTDTRYLLRFSYIAPILFLPDCANEHRVFVDGIVYLL